MPCPAPTRNRIGDLECPACGLSWEPWDGKPYCSGSKRERSREVAARELGKIRSILRASQTTGTLDDSTVG